jgi:energy-coupling factor transporter ATP-binding protein EcfA2
VEPEADAPPDRDLTLPDGATLPGHSPVVIIGPNGSGKTRRARDITASTELEFINALRNTRIPPRLQAMSYFDANNSFTSQRNSARANHWELTNEFDFLLSSLLAQHATAAIKFVDAVKAGETPGMPEDTFARVRALWVEVFPSRQLQVDDYSPVVVSTASGEQVQYSAQTMSDGERAVVYLAGRVLSAAPGVLVVDEPETHLHSLLAARVWDELERARPDIRFVYITHDLTFARTRRDATYVLASPVAGLKTIPIKQGLPDDIAEVLLGAASLSFHARRVVFCEGEAEGRDAGLYEAWFNDRDTVVRPAGSSDMVHRCMSALHGGSLVENVQAVGIIDRDYHPDAYLDALPAGMMPLAYHEVESLYCMPDVVAAVAAHLKVPFDQADYLAHLRQDVTDAERHKVILERWKRQVEPRLIGVVAGVHSRGDSLDDIVASLPQTFAELSWDFSPAALLQDEKTLVETAATAGTVEDLLRVLPGKGRLATAAQFVGQQPDNFVTLVNESLNEGGPAGSLAAKLDAALAEVLPLRKAAVKQPVPDSSEAKEEAPS